MAGLRALGEDLNGGPEQARPRLRDGGGGAGPVVQRVFNQAYLIEVIGGQHEDLDEDDLESADFAKRSLDLHQGESEDVGSEDDPWEMETEPALPGPPGAYIVNAILPYTQVGEIRQVIDAMVEGLRDGPRGHVAVVLGINAPSNMKGELQAAMEEAERIVEDIPFPVGLVQSTFPAKDAFPFGTMRNEVLHSPETRMLTSRFVGSGYHPYISFQDFDTGSRRVGSEDGPHVFDAVDDILAGLNEDSDESEIDDPIRPLMIAGGYRPGSKDELVEATWARVQKEATAKPKKSKAKATPAKRRPKKSLKDLTREDVEKRLENFPGLIDEDMQARDEYARLDPLLPYAPEPNLFIDATAAYRPSPVSGTRLEFGPGAAEFTALGKSLALYAAEELGSHYEQQLPQGFQPGDLQQRSLFRTNELTPDDDALDVLGRLQVDAQNNRHPIRGRSFVTDFQNLSTATDLSRLALGHVQNKTPQSHTGLTQVTDRFFANKAAKTGASFAQMRDTFKDQQRPVDFMNDRYVRQGGVQTPDSARYFLDNTMLLGGGEGQTMSGALQQPLPGPFSGFHFGTSPQQALYFGHQLALQREHQAAWERFEKARQQEALALRQSVQDEAVRTGVAHHYRIGHADGTDHNCTIISIFGAAGIDISREEAAAYRQRLWREAPEAGLSGDVTLTANVAQRILAFVHERNGGHYQLNALQEAAGQGGQPGFVPVAVAGQGTPIFIFFAGAHFSPAWRK